MCVCACRSVAVFGENAMNQCNHLRIHTHIHVHIYIHACQLFNVRLSFFVYSISLKIHSRSTKRFGYTYICGYINILIHIHIHIHTYTYTHAHIYASTHVTCTCLSVSTVWVSLWVWASTFSNIYTTEGVKEGGSLKQRGKQAILVQVCMYVYVYCLYVCVCMYVCMYVCVCMRRNALHLLSSHRIINILRRSIHTHTHTPMDVFSHVIGSLFLRSTHRSTTALVMVNITCMFVCMYILTYSYTHILIYSYTHILIYSYTHTHILMYSYTHIILSYIHILVGQSLCTIFLPNSCTYTYAYTNTYTCTYTKT